MTMKFSIASKTIDLEFPVSETTDVCMISRVLEITQKQKKEHVKQLVDVDHKKQIIFIVYIHWTDV